MPPAAMPPAAMPPAAMSSGARSRPARPGSRSGTRRPAAPPPAAAPAPEDQDSPDWAAEERHRGFFQGFGEDENVDPPRRRHGRWMAPLISLVVILAVIGAVGGFFVQKYSAAHANFTGTGTGSVIVVVKSGDTATSLGPAC